MIASAGEAAVQRSLFRRLLNLAVVALIAHAGWKVGPVFFRYFEFKDRITEAARYSSPQQFTFSIQTVLARPMTPGEIR